MEIKFHVEYSTLISFSSRCPIKIQLCAGVSDGVWFGFVFFIHFAVCRNLGHYRVFHCHLCGYFHSASTRYCLVVGWVGFCSDFDRMKFQFKFEFPFCVWNFTEWKALRREQKKTTPTIFTMRVSVYAIKQTISGTANDEWWIWTFFFLSQKW